MTALQFGSLDDKLKQYAGGLAVLMDSAGPVSDAFIHSDGTRDLLSGPVGSGKTTACVKRALLRATQQPPLLQRRPDGRLQRTYRLTVYRQTYAQLWNTTIKSWCKVLDPNKGLGRLVGSPPRPAQYTLDFEDRFGPIHLEVNFLAWGDDADPDDLGGTESTDAYLNELPTLREDLFINLGRTVGRFPNRGELGLPPDDLTIPYGAIFADANAPEPDSYVYRDFWSPEKPAGYRHYQQPGGFHPEAENLKAVGRAYYHQQAEANRHRPWWIKIKIHHKPGYNRETDVIYPDFDDDVHVSHQPLAAYDVLPVLVGFDGGATPAAAFKQELADGTLRILAEVVITRGDEFDLARGCAVVMAQPRFKGCEFIGFCDPAMGAGEDMTLGSMRHRLEKELGIKIREAASNDPETRHAPIRRKIEKGKRLLLVDATHAPTIRRALAGTYQYHTTRGTGDRGKAVKNPDSHVMEAAEYAAMQSGTEAARLRRGEAVRQREQRRQQAAQQPRYNPLARRRG